MYFDHSQTNLVKYRYIQLNLAFAVLLDCSIYIHVAEIPAFFRLWRRTRRRSNLREQIKKSAKHTNIHPPPQKNAFFRIFQRYILKNPRESL